MLGVLQAIFWGAKKGEQICTPFFITHKTFIFSTSIKRQPLS